MTGPGAPPGTTASQAPEAAPVPVTTAQFLRIFSAVMLPMFLAVADQTVLATATPSIARDLGGLRDTTWVALGYMIAITVTAPLYGRLGDRHGRRDVLLLACAVFAGGSLGCALAPNLGLLVAARVVQGLGGGGLIVLSQALIGEMVPPRERARFQAYFATNFTLANVGGPIIGGLVVHHASWRWVFVANVPLCALAAWRIRQLPQQHGLQAGPLRDKMGAVLFALAATVALAWVSFAGHRFAWISAPSAAMALTSALLGWLLVRRERRHADPFLPVELLREATIVRMSLGVICLGASLYALVFFLPIYLQVALGAGAQDAGLLLLPVTLGIVLGATATGRIIARTGRPVPLPVAGLALSALALGLMAVLPMGRSALAALGFVCGMGLGTVMPTAQVVVQWTAGRERLGAATSLVTLARATGAALGTALIGAVVFGLLPVTDFAQLQALAGAQAGQVQWAFHAGFGATAAIALAGAIACARIRPLRL